jgi:cobalt-zinc-cadmium efflux system membrane fusion protein
MRVFSLGVALLSSFLLGACSARPAAQVQESQTPPPATDDGIVKIQKGSEPYIGVETVTGAKTASMLGAPAHVEFKDGAVSQLGAPLDGRVVDVHVRVGDHVKRGDALVTLDCPDAAEIRAQVESVRASLREARAALDREERMIASGVGTEKERITAETHMQETQAELARVEADAAFVGMGTGTTVVLRAPMSGTVITRKANVGLAVQKGGDPIIELGDPSAVWLVADVFERDLGRVHEGAHATIELPSLHDPIEGRVASIGTVVASGLRTAPVRIVVEGAGPQVHPGMYGSARIETFDGDLTIPTQAVLIKDGTESVVYVQKDPLTFERRKVTVAQHIGDGSRVQITSGLAPGDKVVVKGALLLDNSAEQLL